MSKQLKLQQCIKMLSTANKVMVSAQKKCVLKEKIHFPYLQVFSIIPSAIILGVLHGTISHRQHQVMTLCTCGDSLEGVVQ